MPPRFLARFILPFHLPYILAFLAHSKPDGWAKRIDSHLKEVRFFSDRRKRYLLDTVRKGAEKSADAVENFRQERERELMSEFFQQYREKLEAACTPKA